MSNEALTYIEIDLPVCSLTYGIAPCTASLVSSPPTGTDKCFNSKATCQDTANINLQTVTQRFAMRATYLPRDIDIVSALVAGVEFSPAVVSLGENLGQRASLKVTFIDQPHSDAGEGFDKYFAERSYNPFSQGTLWGKFRARQPFLRGRAIRWINGFVGQTLAEMETRHFFIESINGPTSEGRFTITAKDALKFLDGDRAQAPVLSNGFLVADINAAVTSATLSPSGIGNAEYPASGFVNIGGNEVCAFTRSGDTLTLTRGQRGTTASEHEAQDRVQLCLIFDAQDPADIIADLLEDYTDTPAGYINRAAWLVETGTSLNRLYTATITEPTPVAKLISEIVEQAALALWDDNVNQVIRLQVLRGIATTADQFSETEAMQPAPLAVEDQPDKRVSQVWVYYGQIDPTKRVDDPDNYRSSAISIDDEAEDDYGSPAIKRIFGRWIPALGRTVAERMGVIVLGRYRDPPRRFGFDVMRRNVAVPELGGGYQLQWWNLQDALGARVDVPIQVTRLLPSSAAIHVDAEEMRFTAPVEDLADRQLVVDFNTSDLNWKSAHDAIYPAIESGQACTLTITEGASISSSSTDTAALIVGDWPAGVTLNLIVIGRLQGKAGNGGIGGGGTVPAGNGSPGGYGGPALFTREAINLTDTSGEIWGGGGGGGGGGMSGNPYPWGAGGGGGGAGAPPGTGGGASAGVNANGQPGQPGTTEAGGAGGASGAGLSGSGGAGGGPGLAGSIGLTFGGGFIAGDGGLAGASIDGISFVTTIGGAGDRRGGQIN